MLDTTSKQILADVLRRESLSLLSYMADAYPWTTAKTAPALETLRATVSAETQAITALGRFLIKNKVTPPVIGSYPSFFTSLNFLSLGHLLPRLITTHKELLGQLERDLPLLSKEAAGIAHQLLEVKKNGLTALEHLQSGLTV